MNPIVTIIDGSLGGSLGNTAKFITPLIAKLNLKLRTQIIFLADNPKFEDLYRQIEQSCGFVFCSGTYWDSWGSPLQKFFEDFTASEASKIWFGKPAVLVTTMNSVGGKEVLSRLMGVLNCFGLYVPPFGAMAYSEATKIANSASNRKHPDFWNEDDLEVLAHNLTEAINKTHTWKAWEFDSADPKRVWV